MEEWTSGEPETKEQERQEASNNRRSSKSGSSCGGGVVAPAVGSCIVGCLEWLQMTTRSGLKMNNEWLQ